MPGRRIALALLVLIAACGEEGGRAGNGEQAGGMEEGGAAPTGEWWLVSFGAGADVTPEVTGTAADVARRGSPLTLVVRDDGRVSGFSGCNLFLGRGTIDPDGELVFGALGSTRRACEEPNMDLESAYLGLLERTGRYVLAEGPDGKRLDLRAAGSDEPLLVFRYAGPPAEMPAARQPSGEMEAPPPDGDGDRGSP